MDLPTAAHGGNLKRVKLLVEQGADKDKGDISGQTPLYLASDNGHLDVVKYLVEQGASLDKASDLSWTPLIGAAIRGHLEVTRYLLEQGADREKADNDCWTPPSLCCFRRSSGVSNPAHELRGGLECEDQRW